MLKVLGDCTATRQSARSLNTREVLRFMSSFRLLLGCRGYGLHVTNLRSRSTYEVEVCDSSVLH